VLLLLLVMVMVKVVAGGVHQPCLLACLCEFSSGWGGAPKRK
jgi:hypothetical protein